MCVRFINNSSFSMNFHTLITIVACNSTTLPAKLLYYDIIILLPGLTFSSNTYE